jgi:WD40 repeat protein
VKSKTCCDPKTKLQQEDRVLLANGHQGEVTCVAFSNNGGAMLVSGGTDNVAVVWSTANGDMLSRLTDGHVRDLTTVCFDPSNKFVVTAADDRRIIMWDALTAEKTGMLLGRQSGPVKALAFQPRPAGTHRSTVLLSAGNDGRVLMWRPGGLRNQRIVKSTNTPDLPAKLRKDFRSIRAMACHPRQEWVFFTESCDGRVMSTSVSSAPFKGEPNGTRCVSCRGAGGAGRAGAGGASG